MEQITHPYEFLVRWNSKTGVLSGAHVKMVKTIKDDFGVVIMQQEGDAEPVSIAGSNGFPLQDILDVLYSDALIAVDVARQAEISAIEDARLSNVSKVALETLLAAEVATHNDTKDAMNILQTELNAITETKV